jgi:diacylglycerol kinase family enzyme
MFVNGKVAVYSISAGMLTSSSYNATQKLKKKLGKLAYYLEVLFRDKFRKGVSLKVMTDKIHDTKFTTLACMHGVSLGGFRFFDEFTHNASVFSAVMLKRAKGIFGFVRTLRHMFKMVVKKLDNIKPNKYIIIEKVSKIIIYAKSKNIIWNIDGEKGPTGDVEISIKPNQYEAIIGF